MGLLGQNWDDPQSNAIMQLAGGLLSGNFGKGVSDYGAVMAGSKKQQLDLAKEQMGMDMLKQQIAQATRRNELINNWMMGASGGQAPAIAGNNPSAQMPPMGPGATNSGAGVSMPNTGPTPNGSPIGGLNGVPRDAIFSDLAFNDGKNIGDWTYKQGIPKWENINGNLVNTNAPDFKGGFQKGVHVSSNGEATVSVPNASGTIDIQTPKGALESYGAFQDAKASATAKYDPTTFTPAGAKNPIASTRLQDVGRANAYNGRTDNDPNAANAETLRMLQSEVNNPKYADAKPALEREIARLQKTMGGPVQLQSEAEKTALVDTAKAQVVQDTENRTKGNLFKDFKGQLGYAEKLLKAGPTNSWIGNKADQMYGAFGGSSAGANLAKELETTSGWMVNNIPKAPGAQSNFELEQYKIQSANVGDATLPVPQRMASLNAVKNMINVWEGRVQRGETVDFNSTPTSGPVKDAPLDKLPTANTSNKGRKIRDTETGKVLVSNGLSWVEAK